MSTRRSCEGLIGEIGKIEETPGEVQQLGPSASQLFNTFDGLSGTSLS
ncbi:MAG TPA: hypothetical protein VMV06_04080 [Acidimicrobiales bacterium]|nr:hypothetical protein [Acidimicrobiales bacterium]